MNRENDKYFKNNLSYTLECFQVETPKELNNMENKIKVQALLTTNGPSVPALATVAPNH